MLFHKNMKKNIVAKWMAAKHVLSFPKIRHVHHWQFRDYLFSFWSTHVVILVCVKSEVVFSMHLLYLLSNTQYFISSWWLGKIFELLRDYFGAALLILSIRHANIGIVFLYIENSQWRLYMNSQSDLTECLTLSQIWLFITSLSQKYCNLIGWYWEKFTRQIWLLTCLIW